MESRRGVVVGGFQERRELACFSDQLACFCLFLNFLRDFCYGLSRELARKHLACQLWSRLNSLGTDLCSEVIRKSCHISNFYIKKRIKKSAFMITGHFFTC